MSAFTHTERREGRAWCFYGRGREESGEGGETLLAQFELCGPLHRQELPNAQLQEIVSDRRRAQTHTHTHTHTHTNTRADNREKETETQRETDRQTDRNRDRETEFIIPKL